MRAFTIVCLVQRFFLHFMGGNDKILFPHITHIIRTWKKGVHCIYWLCTWRIKVNTYIHHFQLKTKRYISVCSTCSSTHTYIPSIEVKWDTYCFKSCHTARRRRAAMVHWVFETAWFFFTFLLPKNSVSMTIPSFDDGVWGYTLYPACCLGKFFFLGCVTFQISRVCAGARFTKRGETLEWWWSEVQIQ